MMEETETAPAQGRPQTAGNTAAATASLASSTTTKGNQQ